MLTRCSIMALYSTRLDGSLLPDSNTKALECSGRSTVEVLKRAASGQLSRARMPAAFILRSGSAYRGRD